MSEKDIRFAKARNEMQKEKKVVEERGRDEGRILAAEKNAIRSAIYSPPSSISLLPRGTCECRRNFRPESQNVLSARSLMDRGTRWRPQPRPRYLAVMISRGEKAARASARTLTTTKGAFKTAGGDCFGERQGIITVTKCGRNETGTRQHGKATRGDDTTTTSLSP